jgi:hypothetical protein
MPGMAGRSVKYVSPALSRINLSEQALYRRIMAFLKDRFVMR